VLIKQQLYFRPDWENVMRPVVDYAVTRSEVDPKRIALMGRSWGGYLAPRAVTAEHRIVACIADPGTYDLLRLFPLPKEILDQLPNVEPQVLQPFFDKLMSNPTAAWSLKRGMWTHGVATPFDYMRVSAQYSLRGIAQHITGPTLVCQAESDPTARTAPQLYEALTCPKRLLLFTDAQGAGAHCEAGAISLFEQRAYDWLDEVLAVPARTAR
jgi:pimeloyl-ACP methyl ester carboxylesterase